MNYPNNIKKKSLKQISHGNRGMNLENELNETNAYYKEKDYALIYKKPTPIGIVKVSYENQKKKIKDAYFQTQSTLDYNGIYKGKYIDFDAKETRSKTSFPLSNVHKHQITHIESVIKHGGISFLIIKMNNIIYLLDGTLFLNYIHDNDRKSIPYSFIKEKGIEIKEGFKPALDYLKAVDLMYFKGE